MATYYVDGAVGSNANAGTSEGSGNAWATIAYAIGAIAGGDRIWVKASATYSIGTGLATLPSGTSSQGVTVMSGYTTTPGDGGQATIKATAAIVMHVMSQQFTRLENLIYDGDGVATSGINGNGNYGGNYQSCENLWVKGIVGGSGCCGILMRGPNVRCRVTGLTSSSSQGFSGDVHTSFYLCVASGNAGVGFGGGGVQSLAVHGCLSYANGGHGFLMDYLYGGRFTSNVAYGNGGSGFRFSYTNSFDSAMFYNNIAVNNTAYGVDWSGGGTLSVGAVDYNAYYNNTSGARNNFITGSHDVTLTGSPFVDAANGNLALNTTAGAGAACRAAGYPGVFPGGLTTGYLDIGAVQHADPAGGGGGGYLPGIFLG